MDIFTIDFNGLRNFYPRRFMHGLIPRLAMRSANWHCYGE